MSDRLFERPDPFLEPQTYGSAFLSNWTEGEWAELLRHTDNHLAKAGETIVRPGETDRLLYIVIEGRVEILRPQGWFGRLTVIQECEAGEMFGEQAFIDGRPRSAIVRAAEASRLVTLSPEGFAAFADRHPTLGRRFLVDLARILSLRLRQSSIALERA